MKTVYSEWISNLETHEREIRTNIQDNAKAWVPEIQDKLMDQVALYTSVHGYSVTNYLLENLKKELLEYSRPELFARK